MSRIVVLDSGPIGLLAHTQFSDAARECNRWLRQHLATGARIVVPVIADYEVRRELFRAGITRGIVRFESLRTLPLVEYLPITTEAMRLAAEFWATSRRDGRPTSDPRDLDGDVILAAQTRLRATVGAEATVATTNPGHLSRFVDAALWREVKPV